MRWPKGFDSSDHNEFGTTYLPSLGYSTLEMDAYGGGDEIGFYWPIGQEKRQPLVVRAFHSSFELGPFFSSYQRYKRWLKGEEDESLPMCPDEKLDPDSPEVLYNKGLSLIKAKEVDKALEVWQQVLVRLPEFTLVSSLLAKHHRRLKNLEQAKDFALKSLISPPMFGRFDIPLLKWLGRQTSPPEAYADNPLWTNRRKLQWAYRQKKNDYGIAQEAIDCFFETGHPVWGVTLMQTYSEFMYWESDSTKKRWKYDRQEWVQRQNELCVKHLKASRWPGE